MVLWINTCLYLRLAVQGSFAQVLGRKEFGSIERAGIDQLLLMIDSAATDCFLLSDSYINQIDEIALLEFRI